MPTNDAEMGSVRYMVDDVDASLDFYTKHLGFTLRMNAAPALPTSHAANGGSS